MFLRLSNVLNFSPKLLVQILYITYHTSWASSIFMLQFEGEYKLPSYIVSYFLFIFRISVVDMSNIFWSLSIYKYFSKFSTSDNAYWSKSQGPEETILLLFTK